MDSHKFQQFFVEPRVVRIELPVKGPESIFNCRVSLAEDAQLEVLFPPGKLPLGQLRRGFRGVLLCKGEMGVFTLVVAIEKIRDDRHLQISVVQASSPEQKRDHFRVDAQIQLAYWPLDAPPGYQPPVPVKVNIGGGGLRMPIEKPLPKGTRLGMLLILPSEKEHLIECCAEVVRLFQRSNGTREAAVSFFDMRLKDQDRITAFCFDQQRHLLRTKVRIL
ncbi:hypothetical protein DESUT3_33320 [Desulfuromonas versatilis]|uniref:PilZ domain-containing protein n=1 Tax=Desulfuromonas versatilis TaxID=2802975 RepID=A0ABM8I0B4_9BACT|nr:PilZ domain-containing protein [Desulfuromonas versatilis]BCR06263.1 hypothetical protein DESUT3_33320 [Desulfuromonas versatilis]